MNRGGLAGAAWELDDRFTGHRPRDIQRLRFDAGKLLLRVDYDDPGSLTTLESTARAVDDMAERRLPVFVEPFLSRRDPTTGTLRNDLSAEAVTKSIAIASGLGGSSAYTWLKVPVTANPDDMARVMETSTLPAVLLGGDVGDDQEGAYEKWRGALRAAHGPGAGGGPLAALPGRRRCRGRGRHRRGTAVRGAGMSIICTAEASGSLSGCTVRTEGNKEDKVFELLGRESMFAKVTDFAYASLDARVQIASGAGRRFALAGAKCERRLPARYGTAPEVSVTRA